MILGTQKKEMWQTLDFEFAHDYLNFVGQVLNIETVKLLGRQRQQNCKRSSW